MNHNIPIDNLIEIALNNKEGITASNGALIVTTGKRTGRSPKDRFIVEDSITREVVDWSENNQPIESEKFERLWNESEEGLRGLSVKSGSNVILDDSPAEEFSSLE